MIELQRMRRHWRWGLIALPLIAIALVTAFLVSGVSDSGPAQAASTGPAMSLQVKNACSDASELTSVNSGVPFVVCVVADPSPAVLLSSIGSEVLFPSGLKYTRSTCADELQIARQDSQPIALCTSLDTLLGGAGHAVLSQIAIPPLAALTVSPSSTTTLLELDFVCNTGGSHTLTLTAVPDSFAGATYGDTNAVEIGVKTILFDYDGSTTANAVADTAIIDCIQPPTETPTLTPTLTPTPTVTPTPAPFGPSHINVTTISLPEAIRGACYQVTVFQAGASFFVCDNNIQGFDTNAVCNVDGTVECEDADPATGFIMVAVPPGFYNLVQIKTPENHLADLTTRICDPRPKGKCDVAFEVQATTNASFPWDLDGNNQVALGDLLVLLQHFGEIK